MGANFRRWPVFKSFRGLIFVDASDHVHYTLYNRSYFTGLIKFFADNCLSAKTVKIGPHENFPLYGIPLANVSRLSLMVPN
jgi:hypothetical protein